MSRYAFNVLVFDHTTQKQASGRLVLTADYVGSVEDFKLTAPESDSSVEYFSDFRSVMGNALDGSVELEELDGYEFDCHLGGHYCQVTLEQTALQEDDDGE